MNKVAIAAVELNKATQAAAESVVAEIVFEFLSDDERADLGKENLFGEVESKVDIVGRAVKSAQKQGEPYKFGATAKFLFALPD